MPAPASPCYRKRNDIVTRKVAGEVLLVPVSGKMADLQHVFTLNAVGELLWDLLDGRHRTADLQAAVLSKFAVDEATASQDVQEFLAALAKQGLVEECAAPG